MLRHACTSITHVLFNRAFVSQFEDFVSQFGSPHKSRVCAIVDRRDDTLTLFKPPANCCSFPGGDCGHVQLWYFDASRTCILPDPGYKAGTGLGKALTATTAGTMTFSFHVEFEDEIRCYMFVNGGMMRFLPRDIIDVMPIFFDKTHKNAEWATSEEAAELVQAMTHQLTDLRFQTFLNEVQG